MSHYRLNLFIQTELYNVDRVSKSEGLDGLPSDYSKLPAKVPELGPPLPGDLGLLDDDDDLPLPLPRQLDPAMQRTARLASLDPNDGIEL